MTKATQTLTLLVLTTGIWLTLLFEIVKVPAPLDQIVPTLPLWVIVSFGAYLLGTLGWNIFTFQDKEAAYHSLLKEIDEAKRDLKGRGVTID
ncbi:hypothetical protein PYCC9005_003999 [Savitreella phatthalungensis]